MRYSVPILLLLLIPIQALTSIRWKSATVEEGVHLAAGVYYWKTGDFGAFPGVPPAFRMWLALPSVVSGAVLPAGRPPADESYPFAYGADFLYTLNDADRLLFLGRTMSVLISMLLGFYLYRYSKSAFGWPAAALALFVYAFSPNMLAHGRLATPDLPLAAFFFVAFYYFARAVSTGKYRFVLISSGFAFLTVMTKYSGLLFFPILFIYIVLDAVFGRVVGVLGSHRQKEAAPERSIRLRLGFFALLFAASVFLLNAFYGFEGTLRSLQENRDRLKSSLMQNLSGLPLISSIPVPLPKDYLYGFDTASYNDRQSGHPNWYLGKLYGKNEHWWHYFLTAMALKIPIPLLIGMGISGVAGLMRVRGTPRRIESFLFLLTPPFLYFVFYSFFCRTQLGLRLILPIFPFLFAAVGSVVPAESAKRSRPGMILIGILLIWFLVSSLRIYPHYLSFFNGFAGGPENGIEYFADSNLDWGQDLKGLKKFMTDNGLNKINLVYYGPYGDPELEYYGIKVNDPKENPGLPWAVSATWRYYAHLEPIRSLLPFALKEQKPDDRIGYSIYIYRP